MKKLFPLVLMLVFLFSGCAEYTQEEVDSMVSEAVASASSEAYGTGYKDGHIDGVSEGSASGYSAGLVDGKAEVKEEYSKKLSDIMLKLEEPYPETGTVFLSEYSCYAPLTIENSTQQAYFFKMYDYSDSDGSEHDVLTFFVAPQTTAEVLAPLGTYDVKYAFGDGPWYGTEMLFGENTQAEKFTESFEFTDDGSSYYGYTVYMEEQLGGNLQSVQIDSDTF